MVDIGFVCSVCLSSESFFAVRTREILPDRAREVLPDRTGEGSPPPRSSRLIESGGRDGPGM